MLTAVVCPPAPLLVPGLADRLAAEAVELVASCDRAVAALRGADRVLLISVATGEAAAGLTLAPGHRVTASAWGRSDRQVVPPVRLPDGTTGGQGAARPSRAPVAPVSTGTAVGAWLLAQAGITAPAGAVQIGPTTPVPAPSGDRIGLLVMADGAACHGEHAPGGPDARSEGFDRDIVTALRTGDPAALADTCRQLAGLAPALRADALPALAAMADLTAGDGTARAELLHYSAPFGVGYPVAVWQWG